MSMPDLYDQQGQQHKPDARLLEVIESLPGARVLVVGDLMLDVYWHGEVNRISPEAPVPVVNLRQRTARLGGAGNVALNIAALGGQAHLIACLGDDLEGRECETLLGMNGLSSDIVWSTERKTIVKTRVLAQSQQIVRLDHEGSDSLSETVASEVERTVLERADDYSHIILSDYSKGTITEKIVQRLIAMGKRVIVDPKPQHASWYTGAFVLTPNAQETKMLSGLPDAQDAVRAAVKLRGDLHLDYLLATLGADGMALIDPEKVVSIPSLAQQVFDVTGAGDTVIATLALSLAAGNDMLSSCIVANYAAGIVVEKVGAAQASIPELLRSFRLYQPRISVRSL